jgi:tRNA pseudouridine32 synthase/23S rRNA pseudouridine746 synthase
MRLLAEGRGFLAVDKPAGLVVVPARDEDPEACLKRVVERERGEPLWVVHRLDRGTSGVVLFARDPGAHRALCVAFEHGRVEKTYLAVVSPAPVDDAGTIDAPLHAARKGKMRPAEPGEAGALVSRTDWRVLRRDGDRALLEVRPRTGRQHQIRVHLRFAGMPLLFDPLYGGKGDSRLTLHAWRIRFEDPHGGAWVEVETEIPGDLGVSSPR